MAEGITGSRRFVGAALAALVLVLPACGDDDDAAPTTTTTSVDESTTTSERSTTTTTSTTTTSGEGAGSASPPDTTGLDDEGQIRAVVEYTDQLFLVAANSDDLDLTEYFTGPALASLVQSLREFEVGGFTTAGSVSTDITSVEFGGDLADVQSCSINDIDTVDASGEVVLEGDDTPYVTRTLLMREGGRWKVSEITLRNDEGEKVPCEIG